MNKELLVEELEKIDRKIKNKEIEIVHSPKYKLLIVTRNNLWDDNRKRKKEIFGLKKIIYKKYLYDIGSIMFGFEIRPHKIKSSVKQGIKKGLGLTNVSFIDDYSLIMIVRNLINNDLKKIKIKVEEIMKELDKIEEEMKICSKNKEELLMNGLNKLKKQRTRIDNRLNQKKYYREKRIEEEREKVRIKIKKHLNPKFINKITKEVNKRLILDKL